MHQSKSSFKMSTGWGTVIRAKGVRVSQVELQKPVTRAEPQTASVRYLSRLIH